MKTMLITALILFSQLTLAQARKAVTRLNAERATEGVERSKSYKRVEKLLEAGKSITDDVNLATHVSDSVNARLSGIVTVDKSKLMNLINIDAKLTLAKIFELSSVVKDETANAAEKAEATKALELILIAGAGVNSTAKNKMEAQANREKLQSNISLSEKVATFVNIKGAEKFVADYAMELKKGKSASEAITLAGKGKGKNREDITEEQVKSCNKG